jgi:hypothetical protein
MTSSKWRRLELYKRTISLNWKHFFFVLVQSSIFNTGHSITNSTSQSTYLTNMVNVESWLRTLSGSDPKCRHCRGTGKVRCPTCRGFGKIDTVCVRCQPPNGDGKGYIPENWRNPVMSLRCPTCEGSGTVMQDCGFIHCRNGKMMCSCLMWVKCAVNEEIWAAKMAKADVLYESSGSRCLTISMMR